MKRSCQRGFTLLELLLAVALSLLLGLLAYGGLHLGLMSWQGLDRRLQESERAHLGQQLLRRLLASPQPERLTDARGQLWLAFQGRSDSLLFCASLPGLGEAGQRYWLQLTQERVLSAEPARWRLWLRYRPFSREAILDWDALEAELAGQGGELLLDDLPRPLRFAYLEAQPGSAPRWQEEWLQRSELPLLVRLYGEAAPEGRGPPLPDLSVGLEDRRHAVRPAR